MFYGREWFTWPVRAERESGKLSFQGLEQH